MTFTLGGRGRFASQACSSRAGSAARTVWPSKGKRVSSPKRTLAEQTITPREEGAREEARLDQGACEEGRSEQDDREEARLEDSAREKDARSEQDAREEARLEEGTCHEGARREESCFQ